MKQAGFFAYILMLTIHCLTLNAQVTNTPQQRSNTTANSDVFYHTVERGQTVYAIATMYGVSKDDIYRLNPQSKESIRIGEKLRIPQQKKSTTESHIIENSIDENYLFHTIKPGETLYSVHIKYNIPAKNILEANPGLSTQTFSIGKTIRIPLIKTMDEGVAEQVKTIFRNTEYKVKKKDTFYSIGRLFDVTEQQILEQNPGLKGLKAGTIILIPEKFEVVIENRSNEPSESEINALLSGKEAINRANVINVALLLPFTGTNEVASRTALYIEYYEGFLLSVDSLKNLGYSVNLSVFDTSNGTQKIKNIIKKGALKGANLIIGGLQNDQIKLLAEYSEANKIKYVIPFTSTNDDVLSNSFVFQVNTPHAYLYARASQAACSLFSKYNIVLLRFDNDKDEKKEFVETLKAELKQQNIPYKEMNYSAEFSTKIISHFSTDKKTVIIPTTSSSTALSQILSPLRSMTEANPEYGITLFGYPEWQIYTNDYLEDFYALNTYIYSSFYANNLSSEVKNFYQSYKKWYSKNLIPTYPKYGMLGFDTGFYFLKSMHTLGVNFENNINKADIENVQTGFHFERVNNWGGFINTNIFIIHFKPDFSVTKTAINLQ